MSERIHALAQQLTGKATLEECSLDELRHIIKRHPYFAPAQFLLLQKFRQLNSDETQKQQNKAVLFYHDPLLFDYFISSDKFYVDETSLVDKKEVSSIIEYNNAISEESFTQDEQFEEAQNEVEEEPNHLSKFIQTNSPVIDDISTESSIEVPGTNNDLESFEETAPDNLVNKDENEVEERPASEKDSIHINEVAMDVTESIEDLNTTPSVEIQGTSNTQENLNEPASADTEIEYDKEKQKDDIIETRPEEIANEQSRVSDVAKEVANEQISVTDNKKPLSTDTTDQELTFEPYHTVDYFASQGIKISQEELPKDKLGKQLKSFTEWLKTMKRLPATQITASVEASAEKKVETMAGLSISDSNVVTEAMAEVWIKQGNREKAMEIYNKLSLLDPSKTAYFAAKIENLKHS